MVTTHHTDVRPARHSLAVSLLLGALCGAAVPVAAAAQGRMAIEVSPLRVELTTAAGGSHTQTITLRNQGDEAVFVRARVDEYWLSLDGTPQFGLAKADTPFSASGWVRVNPSGFDLAAGQTVTVRATTAVPAGTTDGAYRCAVMFEFDPPGAATTVNKDVRFRGRVATIVYATVGKPAAQVELVDLQARLIAGEPALIAVLRNAGRGYVRTRGTVRILTEDGQLVREVQVPGVPVLPEATREVQIPTRNKPDEKALEPGQYRVEVRIDVGQPTLLVGETRLEVAR